MYVFVRVCVRVPEIDTRNYLFAGRTGTRVNIGRPQVRWSDGLEVARNVCESISKPVKGSNSLSIVSRIREALSGLREIPLTLSQ